MAVADWVKISPTSGNSNGNVSISATSHTGRNPRTTEVTFKSDKAGVTETRTVLQRGASEYVQFNSEKFSATSTEYQINLPGESNSSKLTFTAVSGDINLPESIKYSANGVSVSNGLQIPGDPGASEKYEFVITIPFSKNDTTEVKNYVISVTDNYGNVHTTTIEHSGADAFFNVDPEGLHGDTITLAADGTAVVVKIASNTSWRVY